MSEQRKPVETFLTVEEYAVLRHARAALTEHRKAALREQSRARKLIKLAYDRRLREEYRNERA